MEENMKSNIQTLGEIRNSKESEPVIDPLTEKVSEYLSQWIDDADTIPIANQIIQMVKL